MRKAIILFLAALLLNPSAAQGKEPPALSAECAVLAGMNGEILLEKNADARRLIASTTKLMTALVALEHSELEDKVRIPAACCGARRIGSDLDHAADDALDLAAVAVRRQADLDLVVVFALVRLGDDADRGRLARERLAEVLRQRRVGHEIGKHVAARVLLVLEAEHLQERVVHLGEPALGVAGGAVGPASFLLQEETISANSSLSMPCFS